MSSRASRDSKAVNATVVTSQKVRAGRADEYQRWQDRMNQTAREFEGFVGAEVYPPGAGEANEWVTVFRFSAMDYLTAWLGSEHRQELLDDARELFESPPKQDVLQGGSAAAPEAVTAVISHEVRPGCEEGFLNWQQKTLREQEKAPGFMGSELFEPVAGVQENWVVVFRFESRANLDDWLASDVRKELLEEGRNYFTAYDVRKVGSSFSGWFRFDHGRDRSAPPNWKQAMTVLLALYPTVMVLNLTVGYGLEKLGIREYIGLFLSNVLSVSALTWLLMPMVNRAFAFWLVPARVRTRRVQLMGIALVMVCYVVFIGVFGLITGQIW
ncbi:antibiotic biosynthesis monooxygenase [Streptomyces tubercidicus]|uniref:antibiotic biosynthesis monooxygenase n=1 Tax=Streptomyces tubercidicus TaxID=47759 RepID=UPI002E0E470C|nr:antibiotic biosynthesis monooxygenase [Streptomyces tubercidicus]